MRFTMSENRRPATRRKRSRRAKIPEPVVPGNLADRRRKLLRQKLRYHWSCLTDQDILRIAGNRDELLTVLHEKYSYTRTRAEQEPGDALAGKVKKT